LVDFAAWVIIASAALSAFFIVSGLIIFLFI
jgi:hypothetical protein